MLYFKPLPSATAQRLIIASVPLTHLIHKYSPHYPLITSTSTSLLNIIIHRPRAYPLKTCNEIIKLHDILHNNYYLFTVSIDIVIT